MTNIIGLTLIALVVIGIQLSARYIRTRRLRHWFDRGIAAYETQNYVEALPAFRKCVRIAPEWLHARTFMSISLAQTGKAEEALKEMQMVEKLQPRQAETWALISLFYALCMAEKKEELAHALDTLAKFDPAIADKLMAKYPSMARSKPPQPEVPQTR